MVKRVNQAGSKIAIQLGSFFRYRNKLTLPYEQAPSENMHVLTTEEIHFNQTLAKR
jgi:hypothetical protein